MISDSLSDLGQREDLIELFFKKWITFNNEKGSVMFDITSLSSYSKSNELLELGYNRDKERLKQLNLGIIGKREKGHGLELPLAYRIYSGSIRDVSTLENMISLINQYRLNVTSFVMDRGFFSQQNIGSMNKEGLFFLLPLPYTTSIAQNISFAKEDQISSPLSSFSFRKSIYFYTQKEVSIHGIRCFLHMYLDKLRRSQEESKLVSKIIELESKFKKKSFSNIQEAEIYIQEALKSKKRFFLIKKKRTKYILKRNEEALKKETLLMGKWILITNDPHLERDEALELYRSRDGIEKIFLSWKQDLHEKRMRVKSTSSLKGSLFINFLSLIIISYIDKIMNKKGLYKTYTKKEVFKILDQLKVFELATKEKVMSEISKKQKQILSAFHVLRNIKT